MGLIGAKCICRAPWHAYLIHRRYQRQVSKIDPSKMTWIDKMSNTILYGRADGLHVSKLKPRYAGFRLSNTREHDLASVSFSAFFFLIVAFLVCSDSSQFYEKQWESRELSAEDRLEHWKRVHGILHFSFFFLDWSIGKESMVYFIVKLGDGTGDWWQWEEERDRERR